MTDTYAAKILADSISPQGIRITTVQVTFPRFILAEFNTHRVFGRNSASSRAIPSEKIIERVLKNPFVPEFNKRVKGMGVGNLLNDLDALDARVEWFNARDAAVRAAERLVLLDVDKSRINRLLEPFMWHTCITTSTEWGNFLALRQPSGDVSVPDQTFPAQPEFQIVARMVRDAMDQSEPRALAEGEWHLPLVTSAEVNNAVGLHAYDRPDRLFNWAEVSAGRCTRVSFDTQDDVEPLDKSIDRFALLASSGHWSPMEHPARPISSKDFEDPILSHKIVVPIRSMVMPRRRFDPQSVFCGHLRGWVCLRKFYENEDDRSRLIGQDPDLERV